jgi:hypothetical protein
LEETDELFKGTPLSNSYASLGLRRAKVFHLIAALICNNIWQPWFVSALWDNPKVRSVLKETSDELLKTDRQKESLWRYTTLKTFKQIQQPGTVPETFLQGLIDEVVPKFRQLLPRSKVTAVEKALKRVLIDAITFWETAQMDGSRISVSTEIDQTMTSWAEALPFIMPEEHEEFRNTSPSPLKPRGLGPLLVFPEVRRQLTTSSKDNIHEDETPQTLSQGLALFADTNIFDLGMEEQEALALAIREAQSRFGGRRIPSSGSASLLLSSKKDNVSGT